MTNTTRESVERLIALYSRDHGNPTFAEKADTAAALRALLTRAEAAEAERDALQAKLAAAYGAARNAVITIPSDYAAPTARITLANAVDLLTPADAQAALDALLRAERVKALRGAAGIAKRHDDQSGCTYCADTASIHREIRALIEKETVQ